MEIETDLTFIARLARQHEDAYYAFRSFLKQTDIPESQIDAMVQKLYLKVSSQIDCRKCANCCKVMSPCLAAADIRRLAEHLGLAVAEFREKFVRRTEDNDGDEFNGQPCPFLKDNACSVYEVRPSDCQAYPHLDKPEFISRLYAVIGNCSICPIVFNVYEELRQELRHRRV